MSPLVGTADVADAPDAAVAAGRALLVCGHPKSGTSLVLSLLDGHPEIVAIPEETKYFRTIHGRPELRSASALIAHTRVGRLCADRATALAQGRDYGALDADRFERELERRLTASCDEADLLPAVASAVAAAAGRAPGRYWAEKTPLHEHHLTQALALWPQLRAIYVERDPRDVHASFAAKRRERGRRLGVVRSALRIRASRTAWRRFAHAHPERALTVRYEHLVREPERTVRAIADFLAIDWSDSLLEPTLAGRPWAGNSMFAERHDVVSAGPVGRHARVLSPLHARAVAWLAGGT